MEEQGRLVVGLGVVYTAAAEAPVVVRAKATEFEDVGCVGGRRGLVGGIRDQEGFVEGNDRCRGIFATVVDVCGGVYCAVGGCCVVVVLTFVRRVMLVRELRIAREYLIRTRVCNADGVFSWSLIKFDKSREALAVVQEDCVG